jgi:hypothetical protein
MKHLLLVLVLLTNQLFAQPKVTGLGPFVIGITTPDSLHQPEFKEQEQVVVKGTLALTCAHIRVFEAETVEIQGIPVVNLSLVFYENRLFRISCKYGEQLQKAFIKQQGKGKPRPTINLSLCDEGKSKRMILESESWQTDAILALAIHAIGYNAQCQREESFRLTIASQPEMAITSECDLDFIDPYVEKGWINR